MIILIALFLAYVLWRLFVDIINIIMLAFLWLMLFILVGVYIKAAHAIAFSIMLNNNPIHFTWTSVIPTIICFLILFSSRKNRHD